MCALDAVWDGDDGVLDVTVIVPQPGVLLGAEGGLFVIRKVRV